MRDALADNPLAGEAVGAADAITQGLAVGVAPGRPAGKCFWWTEPPYFIRDGGFIRSGVHAPLDEVRACATNPAA